MLAARFNQPGAGREVIFWQSALVKWLQFLLRRLYAGPRNSSDTWEA